MPSTDTAGHTLINHACIYPRSRSWATWGKVKVLWYEADSNHRPAGTWSVPGKYQVYNLILLSSVYHLILGQM